MSIEDAISFSIVNPDEPVRRVAQDYGVPVSTLRNRLNKNAASRQERDQTRQLLSPGQEAHLAIMAGELGRAG